MADVSMEQALIQRLGAFLADKDFDLTKLNAFTQHVADMVAMIPAPRRLTLADELRRHPPTGDVVRLHSVLFQLSGDLHDLERIFHYLSLGRDSVEPDLLHYVHWCVLRQIFLGAQRPDKAASFLVCDVFRHYQTLLDALIERWGLRPNPRPSPAARPLKRVALVTNQFIGDRHQPTRDCFDFARLLQDQHGLDARIFNTNLLPMAVVNLFIPPFLAEPVTAMAGNKLMVMFGHKVPVTSFTGIAFDQAKLKAVLQSLDLFNADVVIGFGGSNIIADLYALTGAKPTITIPTTAGFTLSRADIILGFDRHDWTADVPEAYRGPFAGRFRPFTFGYSLPPLDPDADSWTLPDGVPVFAVVGTRLDLEVTADFLALVERMLDDIPDAVVVFAGETQALSQRLTASRHAPRLLTLGHVRDIRSFYRRCAGFLNPRRQGGGGGAAYALAEGVPVVSFNHGDAASVAGPDAVVADEAAFIKRALLLATNPAYRDEAGREAKARFVQVGDRERSADELFHHCQTLHAASGA